ncbi:rubredoxin-like domain-containing protein [Nanoarchaeota archaeon]
MEKKYFRCNVCNDIHYGKAGPEECPTCSAKNAYIEVVEKEAKMVMGINGEN